MSEPGESINIILLMVLLILSAFFSGSETALMSLGKIRLRHLVAEGNRKALQVANLLANRNRLIATILVGNNLVNIAAASISTVIFVKFFGEAGVGIATAVMTILVLIFGEITPKSYAAYNAEKLSLRVAPLLGMIQFLFAPVVKILTVITSLIVKLFGGKVVSEGPFITEEELRTMIDVGQEEGLLENTEKEMLHSIFEFGDKTVKEVMVPRIDIFAIPSDTKVGGILNRIIKEGYTRVPVFQGSIDNIIGVIYIKDLLKLLVDGQTEMPITKAMRPAYYVPEIKKVNDLFHELQREKTHMAIVLDEYGGTEGLVTIEDLIEEIVGEIRDEYDHEEPLTKIIDEQTVLVDAKMTIAKANEEIGIELPDTDIETVGGFVFNQLGRIPLEGESLLHNNAEIVVEKLEGRRIAKVKIIKHVPGEDRQVE